MQMFNVNQKMYTF